MFVQKESCTYHLNLTPTYFSQLIIKNLVYLLRVFILADMNECSVNNGGCEHDCDDLDGSYRCSCRTGFLLGNDAHSCYGEWIKFASITASCHGSSFQLIVVKNLVMFKRKFFWFAENVIAWQSSSLPDIDECVSSPCFGNGFCINTYGGYYCFDPSNPNAPLSSEYGY